MHEQLCGMNPDKVYRANYGQRPVLRPLPLVLQEMEVEQRAHDVDTYDRIHRGEVPLTSEEFNAK